MDVLKHLTSYRMNNNIDLTDLDKLNQDQVNIGGTNNDE